MNTWLICFHAILSQYPICKAPPMTGFAVGRHTSEVCRVWCEFLEWKTRSQHCAQLWGARATLCALIIQQVRGETSLFWRHELKAGETDWVIIDEVQVFSFFWFLRISISRALKKLSVHWINIPYQTSTFRWYLAQYPPELRLQKDKLLGKIRNSLWQNRSH